MHVAVRLFSNRSQVTSKCGKNNKVAHEAIAECVTDVLTTFWRLSVTYYWTDARQHSVLYNKETNYHRKAFFFISDPVNMTARIFLKQKSKMAAEMEIAMLISPRGFN